MSSMRITNENADIADLHRLEQEQKMIKDLLPGYKVCSTPSLHDACLQTDLTGKDLSSTDTLDGHSSKGESECTADSLMSTTSASTMEKQASITDDAYLMPDFIGIKFSQKIHILLKDAKKTTSISLNTEAVDDDQIVLKLSEWPIGELYLSVTGHEIFPNRSAELPNYISVSTEYRKFSLEEAMLYGVDPQYAERERAAWRQRERRERKLYEQSLAREDKSYRSRKGKSSFSSSPGTVNISTQTDVRIAPNSTLEESVSGSLTKQISILNEYIDNLKKQNFPPLDKSTEMGQLTSLSNTDKNDNTMKDIPDITNDDFTVIGKELTFDSKKENNSTEPQSEPTPKKINEERSYGQNLHDESHKNKNIKQQEDSLAVLYESDLLSSEPRFETFEKSSESPVDTETKYNHRNEDIYSETPISDRKRNSVKFASKTLGTPENMARSEQTNNTTDDISSQTEVSISKETKPLSTTGECNYSECEGRTLPSSSFDMLREISPLKDELSKLLEQLKYIEEESEWLAKSMVPNNESNLPDILPLSALPQSPKVKSDNSQGFVLPQEQTASSEFTKPTSIPQESAAYVNLTEPIVLSQEQTASSEFTKPTSIPQESGAYVNLTEPTVLSREQTAHSDFEKPSLPQEQTAYSNIVQPPAIPTEPWANSNYPQENIFESQRPTTPGFGNLSRGPNHTFCNCPPGYCQGANRPSSGLCRSKLTNPYSSFREIQDELVRPLSRIPQNRRDTRAKGKSERYLTENSEIINTQEKLNGVQPNSRKAVPNSFSPPRNIEEDLKPTTEHRSSQNTVTENSEAPYDARGKAQSGTSPFPEEDSSNLRSRSPMILDPDDINKAATDDNNEASKK